MPGIHYVKRTHCPRLYGTLYFGFAGNSSSGTLSLVEALNSALKQPSAGKLSALDQQHINSLRMAGLATGKCIASLLCKAAGSLPLDHAQLCMRHSSPAHA